MLYTARRPALVHNLELRGMQFCVYEWRAALNGGPAVAATSAAAVAEFAVPARATAVPRTPPATVVMLHGWLDCGATFQFLVDHLDARYRVLAPDLRGFGNSSWATAGYWFPDYLADVDALLDHFVPGEAITLVGHSMGGNVAGLYAGVRPERIRHLINLEGLGLAPTVPTQAPSHYKKWLEQLGTQQTFPTYASWAAFTEVLLKRNPRLPREHAEFIAHVWGRLQDDGRIGLRADPKHRRVNPVLYRAEEHQACWQAITADVQFIIGQASELIQQMGRSNIEAQIECYFPYARVDRLEDTGHMMHHEQPEKTAHLIEDFLQRKM